MSVIMLFGTVSPAFASESTNQAGIGLAEEIETVTEITDSIEEILVAAGSMHEASLDEITAYAEEIQNIKEDFEQLPEDQQEALEGSYTSLENAEAAAISMQEVLEAVEAGEEIEIDESGQENSWRYINGEKIDDAIENASEEADIARELAEQHAIEDISAGEIQVEESEDAKQLVEVEVTGKAASEEEVADSDKEDATSIDTSNTSAPILDKEIEKDAEEDNVVVVSEEALPELTSYKLASNSAILVASTTTYQGIDVSEHQYSIDWSKVKAAGIKYAILRVGYGQNYTSQDDKYWATNVAACESLGIPYGVYLYSYATSNAAVDSEVQHTLRLLSGHKPQLPVFYDMEDNTQAALGAATCSAFAERYCSQIKAAGFLTGVYANTSWWNNYLYSFANKTGYYHWVAQYNTTCTYTGRYESWQYSSSGSVNGISGRVDMNYWYGALPNNNASSSSSGNSSSSSNSSSGSTSTQTTASITADDVVNVMAGWVGKKTSDGSHKDIIDLYNSHKPLAVNYTVKYTDSWCDATISAAFIKLNAVSAIGGTECGVERHIQLFKNAGIWIEDGTITPKRGDIITFNWDTSKQPNDGYADHIGIVECVNGNTITTIEGNMGTGYVGRRTLTVGNGYIRGYARPNYKVVNKSVNDLAQEVLAGKWGNDTDRVTRLTNAGYSASAVQAEVNAILKGTTTVQTKITVTFNGNGATSGSMSAQSMNKSTSTSLSANAFGKTGYYFAGWNTKANGTGTAYSNKQTVSLSANTTLYAQWKPYVLTINYYAGSATGDANGIWNGKTSPMRTTKYNYGADSFATYGLPNANGGTWKLTKTGYVNTNIWLVGSANARETLNADTKYATAQALASAAGLNLATGNQILNLYAKMNPITYTVKFDANGGSGSMANLSMTYDAAKTLTANSFTRSGYTFKGWNTKANGTGTSYTDKQSVKNLAATNGAIVTLYAQWNKPVSVTGVTLNKTTTTLNTGASETLKATVTPTNAANKAVKWTSSNTSIATVDANGKVTAKAGGSATITVTTTDGNKKATCKVNVTGWNGKKYYQAGVLVKGQKKIGDYWYMFDMNTGDMKTGWFNHNNTTNPKGGAKTCYYDASGHLVYGQKKIGSYWYMFHPSSGAMIKGWYNHTNATNPSGGPKKVYYDTQGRLLYGKQKIGSYNYYFNTSSGAMLTGWQTIGGKLVFIDGSGRIAETVSSRSGKLTAKDTTGYEGIYRITMTSPKVVTGDTVTLAVWSDTNGRDDLRWYTATKSGSTYIADILINNHKTSGRYQVYAFAKDKNGVYYQMATTTFNVSLYNYYLPKGQYTSKVGNIDYSAVYDYNYYSRKYADLRAAYGTDEAKYLQHFVNFGMKEGRQASANFNVYNYKNRYSDLRTAYGTNLKSYYLHYINSGIKEGRNGK